MPHIHHLRFSLSAIESRCFIFTHNVLIPSSWVLVPCGHMERYEAQVGQFMEESYRWRMVRYIWEDRLPYGLSGPLLRNGLLGLLTIM